MSEVQLITYVNPTIETILYRGEITMVTDVFGDAEFQIPPIAGIVASDLLYLSVRVTNQTGDELIFQIQTSVDNTTYWTLSQNDMPYATISPDGRFINSDCTYEIFTKTILIPASGTLQVATAVTPTFALTPSPYILGKYISVKWSNGDYFYGKVVNQASAGSVITMTGVPKPATAYVGLTAEYRIETDSIPRYLDLYPNESISQNFRFQDISNLSAVGSFSREFRIPSTPLNRETFGFIDEVNFNSIQNFYHTKLRAEILVDTLPIARGFIRAIKSYIQNDVLNLQYQ